MKKVFAIALILVMALACVPTVAVEAEDVNPIGQTFAGFEAYEITAGGYEGDRLVTVDDFADYDVIFINIWSSGCGPCLSEMPYFQQLHENYGDRGVLVMGAVSTWINGTMAGAWNVLSSNGYTYLNVIQDSVIYGIYSQNNYVPQTFICDNTGLIVDFIGGGTSYANLQAKAESWLLQLHDPEEFTVSFVDGVTNEVIDEQVVTYGRSATAPTPPTHQGYQFTSWSPADFSFVTSDMTITANYTKRTYKVRFYDYDGTLLKTQYVRYQEAATAPAVPEHDGMTFIGWDTDFSCIVAATDVTAVYSDAPPFVAGNGDVNGDDVSNSQDALLILRYSLAGDGFTAEQIAAADVNGDGEVTSADALIVLRSAI